MYASDGLNGEMGCLGPAQHRAVSRFGKTAKLSYSLSPAVICVAESAPSAAVAAAASGQTQSVKAG